MTASSQRSSQRSWQPTIMLTTGVTASALLLFLAVALHRADLLALAAPLIAAVAVNVTRRPSLGVTARLTSAASTLLEEQRTDLSLIVDAPPGVDGVVSRMGLGPWLTLRDGAIRYSAPDRGGEVRVVHDLQALRWGRTEAGPAELVVTAGQGLFVAPLYADPVPLKIVPVRELFTAVEAVPHAAGIVGAHRSRHIGEGSDLAGVRPFVVGDRLRRINWPTSLRSGQLHVTATVADRDTAIMLVIDSSLDVQSDRGSGGSLDISVHAAAAIAEHYLRGGDRVGLLDCARPLRAIRPAAGRTHLNRIIDTLIDVTPQPAGRTDIARVLGMIAPRAIIMFLTPLLGSANPDRAVAVGQVGHTVVVVDTLPEKPARDPRTEWADIARRLQILERDVDINQLTERGIPVVAWRGAGSLDQVLLNLSQAARAPRMRR